MTKTNKLKEQILYRTVKIEDEENKLIALEKKQ
jgi:hypothetical protein